MTVQVFKSTDYGAPTFTSAANSVPNILDMCLVQGYNAVNISSLTRNGTTITAVTSIAHNLTLNHQTYRIITISGANESGYNGNFKITAAQIINITTFTYEIATTPASPATGGSLTVKTASAGWTKVFTNNTSQSVFKQPVGSNGFYLNVYDTGSTVGGWGCKGFETMSDLNTGTNPMPAAAWLGTYRDTAAAQTWILITNGKFFYFLHNTTSYGYWIWCFGDFPSFSVNADIYNTCLIADTYSTQTCNFMQFNSVTGHYVFRDVAQTGNAFMFGCYSDSATPTFMGVGYLPYPDTVRNALMVASVYIHSSQGRRGVLPGILNPLHSSRCFADFDVIVGVGDYAGKLFLAKYIFSSSSWALFEISDTW